MKALMGSDTLRSLQRAVGWCETVGARRIKSPRSPSPKAKAGRPTRSFCVKGERIICTDSIKEWYSEHFGFVSLWDGLFFVSTSCPKYLY